MAGNNTFLTPTFFVDAGDLMGLSGLYLASVSGLYWFEVSDDFPLYSSEHCEHKRKVCFSFPKI